MIHSHIRDLFLISPVSPTPELIQRMLSMYGISIALALVRRDWRLLQYLGKYTNNYNVVHEAVIHYGKAIKYASIRLQSNPRLAYLAVLSSPNVFYQLPGCIQTTRSIALAAVAGNGKIYIDLDNHLRADKQIILTAARTNEVVISIKHKMFIEDESAILEVLQYLSYINLSWIWNPIWDAHSITVRNYMIQRGYTPDNNSIANLSHVQLVQLAKYNKSALPLITNLTKELLLSVMNDNVSIDSYIPSCFNKDKDVILAVFKTGTHAYSYKIYKSWCYDYEFVLKLLHTMMLRVNNKFMHRRNMCGIICRNAMYVPVTNGILSNTKFINVLTQNYSGYDKFLRIYVILTMLIPRYICQDMIDIIYEKPLFLNYEYEQSNYILYMRD